MSLRTAISAGGWIGLEFNGTVALTNAVNITNNVILDATGFSVTISGGNAVRIFHQSDHLGGFEHQWPVFWHNEHQPRSQQAGT